jgi:hypothetical protein
MGIVRIEWNILDQKKSPYLKHDGKMKCYHSHTPPILIEDTYYKPEGLIVGGVVTEGSLGNIQMMLGCKVKVYEY